MAPPTLEDIQKPQYKLDRLLFKAAAEGNKQMVELLLAKGANPIAEDLRTRTPIEIACILHHKELAKLMIAEAQRRGLKFEMKFKRNKKILGNPVDYPINLYLDLIPVTTSDLVEKFLTTSDCISKDPIGRTILYSLIEAGQVEFVDAIAMAGANINMRDHLSLTPLHYAVEKGQVGKSSLET